MQSENNLQGVYLYLVMTAIALVAFMISLDSFIVNVAIPTIAGDLGVRNDVGTWVITLFSMASTLFIPVSGMLSLRYGNYKLFIVGLLLFALFSFLVGISHHFTLLLITRILQGASAGLLTPISLALIVNTFPADKKSVAIGFWSFFVMVGPAMGPMIGGWLSDYRWPWMFFLNIPIALFSVATVLILLPHKKEEHHRAPFDLMGMVLLFIWVWALQVATNRLNIHDRLHSPLIISLFILAGICLAFFIVWEIQHPNPFLHLARLKIRNFSLPSLTTGLGMSMLFASFVLDSLWTQQVLGYTPAWAGLTLASVGFFPLIFYPLIGRFVSYLDLRIWVILSFLLYAGTFFWLSYINLYTPFWNLALPRLIQGIGFAIFTVPNSMLIVQGVQPQRLASVLAFFSFTRTLFVGFGVALSVTLWIFREAFYQTQLAARTVLSNPTFTEFLAPFKLTTHSEPKSYSLSSNLITAEASTRALADIYYLYAWLFIGLCFIVLLYKIPNTK